MAHDVFICYSARDRTTANAVCAVLESDGIRCWMAPRDISPGSDYGESIIDGINQARVLVLVFSANANASQSQIKREVERAVSKDIPVIPFRIEDVVPTKALEYFLSTPHWLDAFTPPLEQHIHVLADAVRRQLGRPQEVREQRPVVIAPASASMAPVIAAQAGVLAEAALASTGRALVAGGRALAGGGRALAAIAAALASTGQGLAAQAQSLGPVLAGWWQDRSHRRIAIGIAGLCLAVLILATWLALKGSASPEDRTAWDEATRTDSVPAYESYVRIFPAGYYLDDARSRLSDLRSHVIAAWIQTREAGTSSAYREFIAEWGKNAMFVGEARAAIARNDELQQQERERWANVQERLAAAGYYAGTTDGMKSASTTAAVKTLQRASNLPQTGIVDDATSQALDAAVAQNQAARVAYEKAVGLHTRAAYTAFLASYPAASDAADIRQRIAACHMVTKTQQVATTQSMPQSGSGQGGDAPSACAYARMAANGDGRSACLASGGRVGGFRIVSESPKQDVAGSIASGLLNRLFASTPRARYSCVASIDVECMHAAAASRSVEVCP